MEETIRLPEIWSGWTLCELIGAGSYGDVYRAEYTGDDPAVIERTAAVKIIRIPSGEAEAAALAHEMPDPADQRRYYENVIEGLRAEIRAMEMLRNNPNVVKLQDSFAAHTEGTLLWTIYIRMELLTPLPEYLITHQLNEKETLRLGLSICSALQECEAHGILHRDIKPENIMVSDEGIYKLGDFGVARQMDLTTGSLSLKGTFTYMAPEVYHGEKYDAKADQYSLGIVLYRLLNRNREPFLDPDARMIFYKDREGALRRRMNGEALPPPADASENTAKVFLKACAFRREDRYARIADLKEDLLICMGKKSGEVAKKEPADGPEQAKKPEKPEKPQKAESSEKVHSGQPAAVPGERTAAKKRFLLPAVIGAAAALVLIVLAVFGVFGGNGKNNKSSTAETAAQSSAETAAQSSAETAAQSSTETAEPSSPATPEAEVTDSGTCGENLTWKIAGDTLTISGTGEMDAFRILGSGAPWSNKDFSEVVIEEGVTNISTHAFDSCTKVRSVSLPDSLVRIEDDALDFWNLNSITIPKNVNYFGTGNFTLSSDLNGIAVDAENTVYDSRNSCNALIEMKTNTLVEACVNTVIPDTVTAIGPGAFSHCTGLTRIVIPDSVVSIDQTAFEGRDDLVIFGSAGSAAEEYAEKYGFTFQTTT